jgi:hypothetical protein
MCPATKSSTCARAAAGDTWACTSRLWARCTAPIATLHSARRRAVELTRTTVDIATTLTVLTVISAGAVVWIVAGPGSPLRARKSAKEKA